LGVETLSIGREGLAPRNSCTLEMTGRHLFYVIVLDGGWIFTKAALMDAGDPPQELLSVGDGPRGWTTTARLIRALERSECRSLARPIHLGESGPDSWAIV
jgi:hypothetical protein